jgi:hypothetical protein
LLQSCLRDDHHLLSRTFGYGSDTGGSAGQILAGENLVLKPLATMPGDALNRLGDVVAAVRDPHGRLFILDNKERRVVLTDEGFRHFVYAGRPGAGPGEFREPVSIGVLSDGRIAVLDRALRRVTIFRVRDVAPLLVPERTIPFRVRTEAMCILRNDQLLILGLADGARLHVYDLEGRHLRSFAPADSSLSPMAAGILSKGRIACDRGSDEAVVSSSVLPVVEAFRVTTGARTWADTLRPFRQIILRDEGDRVSQSSGRTGHSLVSNVFVTDGYRVFQALYAARLDGAAIDTSVSYVYSRSERSWLATTFLVPLLFPLEDGIVVAVRQDPEFQVQVSRLTVRGGAAGHSRSVEPTGAARGGHASRTRMEP